MIILVIATVFVALLGSWFTQMTVQTWYLTLLKPAWTPPAPVFSPVWTLLYVLITISGWRILRKVGWRAPGVWAVYFTQLALNAAWPAFFFSMRSPLAGMIEISFLWLAIAANIGIFWKRDRIAAGLLVPYFIWVSYAFALTIAIWRLNS